MFLRTASRPVGDGALFVDFVRCFTSKIVAANYDYDDIEYGNDITPPESRTLKLGKKSKLHMSMHC